MLCFCCNSDYKRYKASVARTKSFHGSQELGSGVAHGKKSQELSLVDDNLEDFLAAKKSIEDA